LPLQGDRLAFIITQGDALGNALLPFLGVLGNFNRTGQNLSKAILVKTSSKRYLKKRSAP
uniref:hypothetical protein n=1 Tax=Prevotella sp. TaxID=59823 RepID=UPI003FF0B168